VAEVFVLLRRESSSDSRLAQQGRLRAAIGGGCLPIQVFSPSAPSACVSSIGILGIGK
jgi:hypothetical protein